MLGPPGERLVVSLGWADGRRRMREMETPQVGRQVRSRLAKSEALQVAYRHYLERRLLVTPPLIFVLGSQRSGTNVLRQSLSLDPMTHGFNERKNNEFSRGWAFPPEAEFRPLLFNFRPAVLFKPIQNVIRRPVA